MIRRWDWTNFRMFAEFQRREGLCMCPVKIPASKMKSTSDSLSHVRANFSSDLQSRWSNHTHTWWIRIKRGFFLCFSWGLVFSSHVFSLLGIIKVRWAEKKSCWRIELWESFHNYNHVVSTECNMEWVSDGSLGLWFFTSSFVQHLFKCCQSQVSKRPLGPDEVCRYKKYFV